MRTILMVAVSLLGLAAPAGSLWAKTCAASEPVKFQVNLGGIRAVELHLLETDLQLSGGPASSDLQLKGLACASTSDDLARLRITSQRQGSTLLLQVGKQGPRYDFSLFNAHYAYQTLQLALPRTVALRLVTRSGDVRLSHLRGLQVTSGSGDIEAQSIDGPLDVTSGSGTLAATGISGVVTASSGSGDMSIRDAGSVRMNHLGSANLKASAIHGPVEVQSTGSGNVLVSDTSGGFSLNHSSSGNVRLSNIGGSVQVGSIGSGNLIAHQVHGNLVLDAIGSGDVTADQVSGDLLVRSMGSGEVTHHAIDGQVSVPSRH